MLGRLGGVACVTVLGHVSCASGRREHDGEKCHYSQHCHEVSALHRDLGPVLAYLLLGQDDFCVVIGRTPRVAEYDPTVGRDILDEVRVTADQVSAVVGVDVGALIVALGRDDYCMSRVEPSVDVRRIGVTRIDIVRFPAGKDLNRSVRPIGVDVLVAVGGLVAVLVAAGEDFFDVGGPVLAVLSSRSPAPRVFVPHRSQFVAPRLRAPAERTGEREAIEPSGDVPRLGKQVVSVARHPLADVGGAVPCLIQVLRLDVEVLTDSHD